MLHLSIPFTSRVEVQVHSTRKKLSGSRFRLVFFTCFPFPFVVIVDSLSTPSPPLPFLSFAVHSLLLHLSLLCSQWSNVVPCISAPWLPFLFTLLSCSSEIVEPQHHFCLRLVVITSSSLPAVFPPYTSSNANCLCVVTTDLTLAISG